MKCRTKTDVKLRLSWFSLDFSRLSVASPQSISRDCCFNSITPKGTDYMKTHPINTLNTELVLQDSGASVIVLLENALKLTLTGTVTIKHFFKRSKNKNCDCSSSCSNISYHKPFTSIVWGKVTARSPTFFKISSFVSARKKLVQVWNNLRVSK